MVNKIWSFQLFWTHEVKRVLLNFVSKILKFDLRLQLPFLVEILLNQIELKSSYRSSLSNTLFSSQWTDDCINIIWRSKSSKVFRDQSWFTYKNLHLSLVLLTKKIELRVNIHVWSSSSRITIISISIDFNWWAPDILSNTETFKPNKNAFQ